MMSDNRIGTSEKMGLKPCPFCRATPHRGPTRMITDQIHGEKIYRYKIWCPHGCATIDRPNEAMTIEDWNARASSPAQDDPVTTEPVADIDQVAQSFQKWRAEHTRNFYLPWSSLDERQQEHVREEVRTVLTLAIPAPPQPGREEVAKAVYDLDPFEEGGEYVDGFIVSLGGKLSWEQAKARDAEFADDKIMLPITKFAYAAADAIRALTGERK